MAMADPVMKAAAGESRQRTKAVISSGDANLPIG
jgi:hypothetical protein